MVFGIETDTCLREEVTQGVEKEELPVLVDDTFEPCELDVRAFFGEVMEADRVIRSAPEPQPVWREKLLPMVLWAAIWYERLEHALRKTVVSSCQFAERLLGCKEK